MFNTSRLLGAVFAGVLLGAIVGTSAIAQSSTVTFTNVTVADFENSTVLIGPVDPPVGFVGAAQITGLSWSGTATPLNASSWGSDLLADIVFPSFQSLSFLPLGSGDAPYNAGTTFTGSTTIANGISPFGDWLFDFYDFFDDGEDGQPDAVWDEITFVVEYDLVTPSTPVTDKFFGSDTSAGDRISTVTRLAGSKALVTAPENGSDGADVGAAYLFNLRNGAEIARLAAPAGSEPAFGTSGDITTDYVAVGSGDDALGNQGAIHLFDTAGAFLQTVQASDGAAGDALATIDKSVALDGERLIGGAWLKDSGKGKAYVWERDGAGVWQEVAGLQPVGLDDNDQFGYSVSLFGDTAVVGARLDDEEGDNAGAAYIFERDGQGAWNEVQKLAPNELLQGQEFGTAIAIEDDLLAISAISNGIGEVYVYERSAGVWNLDDILSAPDYAFDDLFGRSVAIHDGDILIGADRADDLGENSGAAYLFSKGFFGWGLSEKYTAADGAAGDNFGFSVDFNEFYATFGSRDADGVGMDSGGFYRLTISTPPSPPGDANSDGVVDLLDFDVLAQNFGSPTGAGASGGDFNGDGVVDLLDFDVLAQNFGSSSPATLPGAVPEPASLALLALGGAALTRRRG
ncbi:MAG: dockerin type I domain-containing protein [Planctomycetota bacterium]